MSQAASGDLLSPGDVLSARWTVLQKLGHGGCGQVYALEEQDDRIGDLVVKCVLLPSRSTTSSYTKKVHQELINIANTLYYEQVLYQQHFAGFDFIPPCPANNYGEDLGCRYLVLKRLHYDLAQMASCPHPIDRNSLGHIGIHILRGMKALHSKGYLLVDVAPANFMLYKGDYRGYPDNTFDPSSDRLYFIDFGLVEKYTVYMLGDAQRENKHRLVAAGTMMFSSVDVQKGSTPSRKDDLESLGYSLLYLCDPICGLPWHSERSDSSILSMKSECDIAMTAMDVGYPEIGDFIAAARGLSYNDAPDYHSFEKLLLSLTARPTGMFSWFSGWWPSLFGRRNDDAGSAQRSVEVVCNQSKVVDDCSPVVVGVNYLGNQQTESTTDDEESTAKPRPRRHRHCGSGVRVGGNDLLAPVVVSSRLRTRFKNGHDSSYDTRLRKRQMTRSKSPPPGRAKTTYTSSRAATSTALSSTNKKDKKRKLLIAANDEGQSTKRNPEMVSQHKGFRS